jgi:hypothetical protein
MKTTILIVIGITITLFCTVLSFFYGMWIGVKHALPDDENLLDVYCFQCETEMPVKETNGVLYCKNCGLRH